MEDIKRPIYEVNREDVHLLEYSSIFIGNLSWINRGLHEEEATFDFVVREMPESWGYFIFYGLQRFLDILLHLKFAEEDIELLKGMNLIDSPESERYYREFSFSGSIFALRDGTIFFPGEPIIRVTAPIAQANMLTAFILNAFTYSIRVITKKSRIKSVIGNRVFMDSGAVRLPGFEQGMTALEASYILGASIMVPLFFKKHHDIVLPSRTTMNVNHAFVSSFKTEREAFRYALEHYLQKADLISFMIDTYDLKAGLNIFIEEFKKVKWDHHSGIQICIDSGDLEKSSVFVRGVLDQSGLKDITIVVMSSLDEYSIEKMANNNAPIDYFIAGTEVANITDNPKLECVYKIAEIIHKDGTIESKAKLTKGKESYPGRKQIFRKYKDGEMIEDIIGIEGEKLGEPLLHEYIKDGKKVAEGGSLDDIKNHFDKDYASLPQKYKNIKHPEKYPVLISSGLEALLETVKKKHL